MAPHKAVAEVSKMGSQQESLVAVIHVWQSEKVAEMCFGMATVVAVVTLAGHITHKYFVVVEVTYSFYQV